MSHQETESFNELLNFATQTIFSLYFWTCFEFLSQEAMQWDQKSC